MLLWYDWVLVLSLLVGLDPIYPTAGLPACNAS